MSDYASRLETRFNRLSIEHKTLKVEAGRLRKALDFYANRQNWGQLPLINSASSHDVLQIKEGHGYDVAAVALETGQ